MLPQFLGVLIHKTPERSDLGWLCFILKLLGSFIFFHPSIMMETFPSIGNLETEFTIISFNVSDLQLLILISLDCHPPQLDTSLPMGSSSLSWYVSCINWSL